MAFKNITKVMYDGKVKIDYKDGNHTYYARMRENWDLPEDDPKAWGKTVKPGPKGTTTLLGDTLEKKGLVGWAVSLVCRELFGFYNFKDDNDKQKIGYSKDLGTAWALLERVARSGNVEAEKDNLLIPLTSAQNAHLTKKQQGADIGSVVHDAIERHIRMNPNHLLPVNGDEKNLALPPLTPSSFDIPEQYLWNIKENYPMPDDPAEFDKFEVERTLALKNMDEDVVKAKLAFSKFEEWWASIRPELNGAEDIVYSLEKNVCGTYDADLTIKREDHPIYKDLSIKLYSNEKGPKSSNFKVSNKGTLRIRSDWKTSNASKSKDAAAPEGIYYSYFIQLAIYEMICREMGEEWSDDLLCVSARKDGGFSTIYLSELGFTIEDVIAWANRVILDFRDMMRMKQALLVHGEESMKALENNKEEK